MVFAQGTALVVVNSLLVIVGTFGNLLVIFAILKTPQLRHRVSNFLLLSLAVADLFVTMIAQPMLVVVMSLKTFAKRNVLELEAGYIGVASFSSTCSALHLAVISIDRALCTIKPHQHPELMKKWVLKVSLCICWTAAVLNSILYSQIASYGLLSLAPIFLAFAIIMCSYGCILYKIALKKPETVMETSERERAMQRRVSGTIGIVIVLFALCWIPIIAYHFAKDNADAVTENFTWIRTLYLSNSSMNFIVYSLRIRHFRVAYLRIINRILQRFSKRFGVSVEPLEPTTSISKSNGTATERVQLQMKSF